MTAPVEDRPRRRPVAVIGAVFAAGLVAASLLSARAPGPAEVTVVARTPTGAQTTAWYCAGASAVPGGQADGTILVTNAGPSAATGEVTLVSNQGGSARLPLELAPWSSGSIHEADALKAPFVAATVVVRGGHVSVEQDVTGALGEARTVCASQASPDWYLAAGTTVDGASLLLALYNPFPADAIVDLSFATGEETVVPAPFQGIYVPSASVVMVDVGSHVVNQPVVATTVSARSGSVVAAKLQLDTVSGQQGLSLVTAAPAPAKVWRFPDGGLTPGVSDTYYFYNPSAEHASVTLSFSLAVGRAEPFRLEVPGGGVVALSANGKPRIPLGDGYTVTARSRDGAIVAERVVVYPSGSRQGTGDLLGGPEAARRWILSGSATDPGAEQWVIVVNPGSSAARVQVAGLAGARQSLDGLEESVGPGERLALKVGDRLQPPTAGLLVEADRPVLVERDIYRGRGGVSTSLGTALGSVLPLG